jgi:predicted amidohydrolase
MQDLKVTLIQSDLHWKSPQANLAMFEEKIWKIKEPTDLVILPEMFNTGFTMDAKEVAEPMNFQTYKWMKQMAAQTKAVVTGSVIIREEENYYNRLLWMEPDGNCSFYNKRHLFRMAEENKVFTAGDKKLIKQIKGWKICPLICYDLRFPVWSRNVNNEYDLLIYVANWPQARSSAWNTLLRARAMENLSYAVGVNRIGTDGNEIFYSGDSAVLGPKGEDLFVAHDKDGVHTHTLSYQDLKSFKEKFPANLDADGFEIK